MSRHKASIEDVRAAFVLRPDLTEDPDQIALWDAWLTEHDAALVADAEITVTAASVPVSLILRERAAGWPTIHPEDFCHRCGAKNMLWFVDRDVWLAATAVLAADTGREGIFCPQCFADLHAEQTGNATIWKLIPESQDQSPPGFSMAAKNEALAQIAEMTAERDAAREQAERWHREYLEDTGKIREQLAAAETVIEKALDALPENRPDGEVGVAVHKAARILSWYPVSSALLTHATWCMTNKGCNCNPRYEQGGDR